MKNAFSLVETILYIGLSSTLIVSVLTIITFTYQFKSISENSSVLNSDIQFIDSKIRNIIQNSNGVIFPTKGATSNYIEIADSLNSKILLFEKKIVLDQSGLISNLTPTNYEVISLEFVNNISAQGSFVTYKAQLRDNYLKIYEINGSTYKY